MTTSELIYELVERTGVPSKIIKSVLHSLSDSIVDCIKVDEPVQLRGIGKITRRGIKFSPGFKERIKKNE